MQFVLSEERVVFLPRVRLRRYGPRRRGAGHAEDAEHFRGLVLYASGAHRALRSQNLSQDLAGDTERTHFKTQRPRAAQDVRGKMDPAREPLLHFLPR